MLFTSLEFLLFFFPITLGVYFFLPSRGGGRNYWLLLASLFFYAWGEPTFVLIMICSILCNYFAALHIEEMEASDWRRNGLLILTVLINLGILFIFKYMNFTAKNLRAVFPMLQNTIPQTSFVLPIGISFFTFQALSYVIDVYRGIPAQKNLGYLGLYISLFPQLIAGPIVRYTTVMDQMEQREITWDLFSDGMLRFLYGFSKKMLLANLLAEVADAAFGAGELSVAVCYQGGVLLVVVLGWVLFRAEGLLNGLIYLKDMFGLHGNVLADDAFLFYLREYGVILTVGLLCSTPLLRVCGEKLRAVSIKWGELWDWSGEAVQLVLFIVGISFLIMNAHNPFIYFNF